MKRRVTQRLLTWLNRPSRKPLILRGARRVGKTWLVRDLAHRAGLTLIELNFERDPATALAFESNDPRVILGELELLIEKTIRPAASLLFIDETRAQGRLLGKLRWFHEELPELPIVAAGSLLEFALADHNFTMPVGRITFEAIEHELPRVPPRTRSARAPRSTAPVASPFGAFTDCSSTSIRVAEPYLLARRAGRIIHRGARLVACLGILRCIATFLWVHNNSPATSRAEFSSPILVGSNAPNCPSWPPSTPCRSSSFWER